IAECVKSGVIKDVAGVNDASDRKHEVRIEIDLRSSANEDVVINQLFQYTPLQSNYHIMNIALVDRQPRTLTLKQMLSLYVDYRKEVVRRRTSFLLKRAKQRAHILEGLILAVGDIDEVINIIKASPNPDAARQALMARPMRLPENAAIRALLPDAFVTRYSSDAYHLTATQAGAILSMQLQRLTGLEIEKLASEYGKLVEEIEGYEAILRDERLVRDIIREDLHEIKEKFTSKRRTEIVDAVGEFRLEELVPDEQVVVTISREGYIKRTDVDTYRKQGRGGKGIRGGAAKEGDFLEHLFVVSTHDFLLFFTDRGRVYWARVFDLPVMARTSRGRSIANLLHMQPNESHRAVLPVRAFEESFVFFATAKGIVKKTPMTAFSRPRPSGIIAITLEADDALINVERTTGENEIVLGSRNGMAIRFQESDVRAMGRGARGVRGMALTEQDAVVSMVALNPGDSLLTVCEKGFGKRTSIDEYRKTRRGGKGVINIKTTERNGAVVSIKAVTDQDELMLITAEGMMLRTDLSALREIGRATQGVRVIRLDVNDRVVAVARIAPEHEGDALDQAVDVPGDDAEALPDPDVPESEGATSGDVQDAPDSEDEGADTDSAS
ncbi:MAG: DNA gyrase C-terminal beta-propeller domain-containing protein, partial [Phycisphaerae bacterium]